MKFLLDQNLSPGLVGLLEQAGHTASHVRDLDMREAADHVILAEANQQGAVLISADTDFGELLAHSNAGEPSVILLRRQEGRRASEVAGLILANLDAVADDLAAGAFVVLHDWSAVTRENVASKRFSVLPFERLENCCTSDGTGGSNPPLSATIPLALTC